MAEFPFHIHATEGDARTGRLSTPRGDIATPAFMPLATAGAVKALYLDQVRSAGSDIILGNTYHLMLRPGGERIKRLGGLHRFMRWDKPILTDSGGYQVMSLAQLRKLDADGVTFRSHVDGGPANRSGAVQGYQVELDPSDRAFTAGIYDEQRRGWLHPLSDAPYARRAYRPGEWNSIRILARGPVIQTWVNGVPGATVFDALTAAGHLGLQVHSVGEGLEGAEVRFRNVRVREMQP